MRLQGRAPWVDALLVAVRKSLVAQRATAVINHSRARVELVNALLAKRRKPARQAVALNPLNLLQRLLSPHVPARFANAKHAAVHAIAKPATAQSAPAVHVIAAALAAAAETSNQSEILVDCTSRTDNGNHR